MALIWEIVRRKPAPTEMGALRTILASLPRGLALSPEVWVARHRIIVRIVVAHIPFLVGVGLVNGEKPAHIALEVSLVAALLGWGWLRRTRLAKALFVSLALLSASGLLVHYTDGLIESHFHFFVALPLVALYQDWRPFLSAILYVVLHHGVVGYLNPTDVYNHPAAIAHPLKWAFIHAAYVLGLVAVLAFHWRVAERAQMALEATQVGMLRANRILRAVSECNDALIRATSEQELLDEVCRIVVEAGDYQMAWVGYADDRTRSIKPIAVGGFDDGYVEGLRLSWPAGDRAHGPAGRAVRTRSPVVIDDIASDTSFAVWREAALGRGYRSVVAVPLIYGQDVLGVLAVYSGDPGVFDEEGIGPLQRFADDLAFGIGAIRTRESQRVTEEKLRETVRSKDDLIATIAHELRTPLTAVVGFADVLLAQASSMRPDELRELIRIIADEGMDLSNIVDDLLVAAKTEAGTLQLIQVRVDLRAQCAQVLERWEPEAISHVRFIGSSVTIVGDPARARQIIRNLVSNAIRYGGDEVTVEVSERREKAVVQVRDNGPGVPPDEEETIFQPYRRAKAAPGLTASMGLGLTISRQLAQMMGGDISYRHESGESVFELTLPLATAKTGEAGPAGEMEPDRDNLVPSARSGVETRA